MQKLSLREIKQEEMKLLLKLDAICKENNLCYTLAGGTLLGAVRHSGFIPWDDDIDVGMPRNDYNKFLEIVKKENTGKLKCLSLESGDVPYPFAKLVNTDIVIQNPYQEASGCKYLWVDVLPMDGLPEKWNELEKVYHRCDWNRKCLYFSMASNHNLANSKRAAVIKRLLRPLCKIYDEFFWGRKIDRLVRAYRIEDSDYLGVVSWGLYGAGERMKKSEFYPMTEVLFEKHKFPAMGCWDSYLKGIYGDYMTLPPEEKRVTHDIEAFYK